MRTVIFATGGSGGHIYPALAVAEAGRGRGEEVAFLGQSGGLEEEVISRAGFRFHGVRAGKWDRGRPNPRQALSAATGVIQAVWSLRIMRAELVVGFGGFASFPGCAAATLLRIPLVLHEGNAFPGRVTRWFATRARAVVGAQPEVVTHLPKSVRQHCFVQLPQPVRERRVMRPKARADLGLPADGPVTLVMGGSQGSMTLNRIVPEAYRQLKCATAVLHSTGTRWHRTVSERVSDLAGYRALPYIDATLAWSASDLGITRSGVSTLAEAAYHGVPLIMVPLPSSAEQHQLHNARAVESAGGGTVVEEADLKTLAETWDRSLEPSELLRAGEAAWSRSSEGAALRIWDLLDRVRAGAEVAS